MGFSATVLILSNAGFNIFLPFLLFSFHVLAMSTDDYINSRCIGNTTNGTVGSLFEDNMQSLFSTLRDEAYSVGFAKASKGSGSDKVYGLVQCRGDVVPDVCKACITNSTQQIVDTYCPDAVDAIIWYEKCQLRYSNTNFFGVLNVDDYGDWYWTTQVDNPEAFDEKLGILLKNLTSSATTEPSRLMFATGKISYSDLKTIYGLVQCTRDTSLADCNDCLTSTISQLRTTCDDGIGCEIATGSCRVRFDTKIFYQKPSTPSPSSSPAASSPHLSPRPSSVPDSASPSSASNITSEKSNHPSATSVTLIPIKITIALTSTWLLMMQSWI